MRKILGEKSKEKSKLVKMGVATQQLGNIRVGRFANVVTLDSKDTIQETIDYHDVTGKAPTTTSSAIRS